MPGPEHVPTSGVPLVPAPIVRPPWQDYRLQAGHAIYTSPDGKLGHIGIHKCGTNTWLTWVAGQEKWNRSWPQDWMHCKSQYLHPSEVNPERVLIIVRDPVDRYLSGMQEVLQNYTDDQIERELVDAFRVGLPVYKWNQHVWPYRWFVQDWIKFEERMDVRDISQGHDWFKKYYGRRPGHEHLNKAEPGQKDRMLQWFPEDWPARVREVYHHDYVWLEKHGLSYPDR
jgi:hypothetical protein